MMMMMMAMMAIMMMTMVMAMMMIFCLLIDLLSGLELEGRGEEDGERVSRKNPLDAGK